MHVSHRTLGVLAIPLLTATALAGCGSDKGGTTSSSTTTTSSSSTTTEAKLPKAAELFDQARKTALAAKSAHITGSVTEDGKDMTIDLAGTTDGSNQTLELGMGKAKATILTVGGKYYLLGDDQFWTSQISKDAAKLLADKYVRIPAAEAKDFGDLTIKSLLTELFEDKEMKASMAASDAKVSKATYDGAAAYSITDGSGKDKEGEVLVSADGKATIFKIVGTGTNTGTLEFSEWDKVAKVAAPAPSKVINLPK